jgi:hypothetical protein
VLAAVTMAASNPAYAQQVSQPPGPGAGNVAPGLNQYTQQVVEGDLWRRPDLTPRHRSVVTVSALIAAGQTAALNAELNVSGAYGPSSSAVDGGGFSDVTQHHGISSSMRLLGQPLTRRVSRSVK